MRELNVSDEVKDKARALANANNSTPLIHLNNNNKVYGFIGEVLFQFRYPQAIKETRIPECYHIDYWLKGKSVDVKSVSINYTPKPEYEFSISFRNDNHYCDFFYFYSVKKDLTKAWEIGFIRNKDFWDKSVFKKKGEMGPHGFPYRADCYCIKYKDLMFR